MIAIVLAGMALAGPAENDWAETLDAVVPGVVSIRTDSVRAFDMDKAGNSVATGFVVDADAGIILSNRHVVGPGPTRAEAVFLNHEEVELTPIYRDPVHDFGFYRFDPSDVRFMDVVALPLAPEAAIVGTEIRVVGNDAGDKLSILEGTLARVDRAAPSYGVGRYNDFNTFYYQAASGTSGGSSGSPVLNRDGRVIALNAGGRRRAASSFFLPLDRVARALEYVQAGETVPRGTLEATFSHQSFDQVARLGVSEELEADLRADRPDATGLLVVSDVVLDGVSSDALAPGDVVLAVDDQPVHAFVPLETVVDSSVGVEIHVTVLRGGEQVTVPITVGNLHAITPSAYLEFGGGVLHPLGYQQARTRGVAVRGVVVASEGYTFSDAGLRAGDVILEVAGHETPTLDALEQALAQVPHGERVSVRSYRLSQPLQERLGVLRVDRRWFPMQMCQRNDDSGEWTCDSSPAPTGEPEPELGSFTLPEADGRLERRLARSLVSVDFDAPVRTEGLYHSNFLGTGVIVDKDAGLVLVDRDTVPVALGDVQITFGSTWTIAGEVLWLHPDHNIAIVRYDPASVDGALVDEVSLDPSPLEAGARVWHVGLTRRGEVASEGTRIEEVRAMQVPLPRPPFFRETNSDVYVLESAARSTGGVVVDRRGRVRALWASFADLSGEEPDTWFAGLPSAYLTDALDHLRSGVDVWPAAGVEFARVPLAYARDLGLDDSTAREFARMSADRQMLGVVRLAAGSPAASVLEEGDLILAVNGQAVTRAPEVEGALRRGATDMEVVRRGARVKVSVEPWRLSTLGTTRVVGFAGALVHEPHSAVAKQRGIPLEGVYVAWYAYGSPAGRYGLQPTRRIVGVDGLPVDDLDAFLEAVGSRELGESVRLDLVDLQGRRKVVALEADPFFWPTYELRRTEDGWKRLEP